MGYISLCIYTRQCLLGISGYAAVRGKPQREHGIYPFMECIPHGNHVAGVRVVAEFVFKVARTEATGLKVISYILFFEMKILKSVVNITRFSQKPFWS